MPMLNPPHPGKGIKKQLDFLEVSINGYAKIIEVSPSTVSRLVNGETSITAEMALKLAATIGSTPEHWLRLQAAYDLAQASKRIDVSGLHLVPVVS